MTIEVEPNGDGLIQAFDAHRQNVQTAEGMRSGGLRCRLIGLLSNLRQLAEPMKHADGAVYAEELRGQMRQRQNNGTHRQASLS